MISRLNVTSIYVLDKDVALDFYVNKLGLEKGADIRQGPFRWLTVRFPNDPAVEIFLEEGVAPEKIQIAHCGDSNDVGYIEGLLDKGVWVGLDRYGLESMRVSEQDLLDGAELAAAELPEPEEGAAPPGAYTCC